MTPPGQPPEGALATASPPRLDWPDAAKGIGIMLVVAGHVLGGIIDSDLALKNWPVREVFVAIYVFHMPLFFLLSGLFVAGRIKRDPHAFLWDVVRKIYYPYLLWAFIQFTLIYLAGRWTNTPPGPYLATVIRIPFSPLSQFWFLLVLAGMHVTTFVLLPRVGATALVLMGLVMRSVSAILVPDSIPQVTLDFFFFYALGLLLGPAGVRDVIRPLARGRAALGIMSGAGLLILTVQVMILRAPSAHFYQQPRLSAALMGRIGWGHVGLGAALAMTAATIVLAEHSRGRVKWLLVHLGRLSMPIYLLHVIFVAGLRIVLVKLLGITDVTVVIPVLMIIGIAGPVGAYTLLSRLRLARPLGLA